MNLKIKNITAVIIAVILLIVVIPYLINFFWSPDYSGRENFLVRVKLADNQIKSIPVEEYLIGVVAAEMPAEFQLEALKAQAIAARTYVIKKMEHTELNTFDVDTTEKTQAWNSKQTMIEKWGAVNYWRYRLKISRAVQDTCGMVLTYNGQEIEAVYHSSCGRKSTENASEVWNGDTEYLRNVESGEVNPLRFVKHQIFDCSTFYKMLGFSTIPKQISASDLVINQRTEAGRVKAITVRDKSFLGTEFRSKLQLPSTDFEWKIQGSKIEIISYGQGHAVGMSQYGANDLAKADKKFTEILSYYYPGTKLERKY